MTLPGCTADATDFGDDRVGATLESVDRLPIGRFDRSLLQDTPMHGGKGRVGRRAIWGPHDFCTSLWSMVHFLLPPDTSIGYHRHDTVEQCYIVINGSGRMTGSDETVEVFSGDVILNPLGGSHGIYNHTNEGLELLLFTVCMEKGQYDETDLHDDLARR